MPSTRPLKLALFVLLLVLVCAADAPARARSHGRRKPAVHHKARHRRKPKPKPKKSAPAPKRTVHAPIVKAPAPKPVKPTKSQPTKSKPSGGGSTPAPPVSPPATPGIAPTMVAATDQGFWLGGEKIVTVWSQPVHIVGAGGADSFAMTNGQGAQVQGQTVSTGSAADQIVVNLPAGADTPTKISYTAGGGTVIANAAGRTGSPSASPLPVAQTSATFAGTLADPFSRSQMMPFGARSFWLQPWRSYQDTWPATRMLNAVGINFNVLGGHTDEVDAGARLLHDAGFTHARIEVGWNNMSYSDPGQLSASTLTTLTNTLQQLQANGVRPLILLNSNDGIPCPVQPVTLNLTAPAPAGATTVSLDSASVALVRPGYTGFQQYGKAAGVIITSVDSGGVAHLSQPLKTALAAGSQPAVDLAFQPFFPQYNADGTPNATNQATLAGWLQYVAGVTQTVKQVLGNDNFDVEIWNELSFGSAFLDAGNYYMVDPQGSGNVDNEILQSMVGYIRDPANGLGDVGIGNGFANEQPFAAGSNQVPGVTAIDKHPYHSAAMQFPAQAAYNGDRPWDALGQLDSTKQGTSWVDNFVPNVTALFPEWFLSGIQTETVTRDLAPFTSDVYGTPHGRTTAPAGGRAPQMWVTEVNLSAPNHTLTSRDGTQTSPMSAADVSHFEAKAILRYLASWVGKGVSMIDFYAAANAGDLNLIAPSFWTAADAMHGYPGLSAGGETMNSITRFLGTMSGAQSLSQVSPISLDSISDYDGGYQFLGNGTTAFPTLYNRSMINFDPFQVTAHKWVIPTYVTTLDLATLYNPSAPASDVTRQDMPQEVFSLTLSGVDPATAGASATDPLTGTSVPVRITDRGTNTVTLEIPLTDYPRMLTLTDG